MTTKFKAIASAVTAAAIAATVSATSLATSPNETDLTAIPAEPENLSSETVKTEYGSLAEMLTPFELAALMGEPIEAPDGRTIPKGHRVEVSNNANSDPIALKKLPYDVGYNYWVGTFTVSDLSGFTANFIEPESFTCSFSGISRVASMTAKPNYTGNFKKVRINYTFQESNGEYSRYYVEDDGTGRTISADIDNHYTGNGKLVEAVCYYCLRSGTGSGATIKDYAVAHFVDSSYATTAEYAAEPYSGLIDTYTYIPAEMCQ